jgi:hypothetical protein
MFPLKQASFFIMVLFASFLLVAAAEGEQESGAGENASDPLAKVRNTDLRWQYFDLQGGGTRNDFYLDGSWMFGPKLKLKYDLHYWETDVTGRSKDDWESLSLKPIYFPKDGKYGTLKYRLAVGCEWIIDFGNADKGIGSDADQIAPLIGVGLIPRPGTTLIPLVQHFVDYDGDTDVNQTSLRLIGLQKLPSKFWGKLDFKLPFDWENNTVPATLELQLGRMFMPEFGVFVDGLFGIGGERPYDYGFGLGLRTVY